MSQQYPNQPPYPGGPQYTQPQIPQQKKSKKKWVYIGVGAAVFVIIIAAASSNGSKGNPGDASPSASHVSSASTPKKTAEKPAAASQAPAQAFQAWVTKNGTPTEKTAAQHVTKIQGANGKNDILDTADIYTDYSGDLMSSDTGSAKLLASSFADWEKSRGKDSKNGLVTVYNKSGEILSNGQY